MRAKLMFVVLVFLLLVQPMAAIAAPPPPNELAGAEPGVPALLAAELKALDPASLGATLKWYTVAGAGFMPYTNTLTWDYGGSGCIKPATIGFWRANINLPDGAVMQSVYFGFYNSATSTASTAYIYRYHYTGDYEAVTQLTSIPGSSGTGYKYTSKTITAPGETISNFPNAYMFVWSGSGNQELCYIQIGYTPPPIFGSFLPLLQR